MCDGKRVIDGFFGNIEIWLFIKIEWRRLRRGRGMGGEIEICVVIEIWDVIVIIYRIF